MYQVSNEVLALIQSRSRKTEWEGTITLTDGTEIAFNRRNINAGTGSLNLSCAPNNEATWGNAYLGELVLGFTGIGAERTRLQDAVINLHFRITGDSIATWGEAAPYTWGDLSATTWGEFLRTISIPMGLFAVSEAMRDYSSVKVRAYDNMRKFDKPIPAIDEQARTPYQWLTLACSTCGVVLGMTYSQVFGLPNGRRLVKYAGTDNTIKTWRDLLSAVCAMVGANAVIDRSGALILRPYNDIIVDAITPSARYSSSFSDYESYYTGLKLSINETGIEEYATNAPTPEEDTGLVFSLGYNPFMQITDETARNAMMQELIDRQSGLRYTPFRMTGPLNPLYDLMDTLIFTGNHAEDSTAPITNIVYRIGGEMSLSCGGENPALMTAESKESKALEGMSSNSSYGEDLWMLMGNAPAAQITIEANTETLVGEILLYAKEINSMVQIAYTAAYNLSKTALVTVRLAVDDDTVYTVEQNQFIGANKITATTGYQFRGIGSHAVRAYLIVSEATIDIGGGGVLTALNVTENGLYTAADKGVYGFSQVTAEVGDGLGYTSSASIIDKSIEDAIATYENDMVYQSDAALVQNPDISGSYCKISESIGDGASFNGRYFTRTDDSYPLLFINFALDNGYNSYGVISNHEEIPPQTCNGYGDLVSWGTLQVDGNTFYVFAMRGLWAISRDGIIYNVDGQTIQFVGSGCYILYDSNGNNRIAAINSTIENDFKAVLARFASMG